MSTGTGLKHGLHDDGSFGFSFGNWDYFFFDFNRHDDDHGHDHGRNDLQIAIQGDQWVLTNGHTTNPIVGDSVALDGKTYLFVDQFHGGFQTVADAVNAANGGETILIAPGTYNESTPWYAPSVQVGLYINKPGLTLQGVDAHGHPITQGEQAQSDGPTIVAAHQTDPSGASFFIDVGGTNTTIQGLHLEAGPESTNKLVEFWADNVTLRGNFIDEITPANQATGQAAIYINEITNNSSFPGDPPTPINSYTIDDNVMNSGIYVANGVGTPGGGISATQKITDNAFIGQYHGDFADSYDMVSVQGEIPGIGWQPDAAQVPTMFGNTREDDTSPFIFRMTEKTLAFFPTADEIAHIADANTGPDNSYAYLLTSTGDLQTSTQDLGSGPFFRYYVANSIDTLNLGVDNTPDSVYSGKRIDMLPGDKLMVQSGHADVNSDIVADDLTVIANKNSDHLHLALADTLPDGTPVTVQSLTLGDYSFGHGANVDVTGNALANTIVGNSGNNVITGGGGADLLTGGGGKDTFKFLATGDSAPGAGNYDTITDFQHGKDVIDLSAIDANTNVGGDQAFAIISGHPASVHANTVTWYQDFTHNQTIIQADTNGNTVAELEIHLAGLKALTATDFIV